MTPDMLPAVVATAVVVLLLVLGALRVATGYRKARSKLRRLARTRLVLAQVTRTRRGKVRRRG